MQTNKGKYGLQIFAHNIIKLFKKNNRTDYNCLGKGCTSLVYCGTIKDKKLRTICQLGNLAFSLLALGVFIPLYTRTQTNKKRQQELAMIKENKASQQNLSVLTQAKPVFANFISSKEK